MLKNILRSLVPIQHQVFTKYYYNRLALALEPEMKVLGYLFKKNDLVIDVGGNRGIYAYRLWRLGGRVEVFEPNPACLLVLQAWAADKPSVNIHSLALSSRAGSANLHIPIDDSGVEHDASASIEHAGFAHVRDQQVSLRTLDSYGFENVSLIKIDVEGHEYNVIDGAQATLASSRPALLVEIEQRHNGRSIGEVFGKIQGFGYRGYFMRAGRLVALEDFDVARHQSMANFGVAKAEYINNFLFLNQGRLADGEYGALFGSKSPR